MKRMIEVSQSGKYTYVFINSSSLDIIQTCPRKAQYALKMGYRKEDETEAMAFGSSIHAGIEKMYSLDPDDRRLEAMIDAFTARAAASLSNVPPGDKRSISNGHKILKTYFETYRNDPWKILLNSDGQPMVEQDFQFPLMDHLDLRIHWFGRVDAILKNTETGEVVVCDHKTTSSLGVDFFNRVKPNHQFTGYVLACQKFFGLPVNQMMVDGIQVAKTKCDLTRVFTYRGEDDFDEFKESVLNTVQNYLDYGHSNQWPMNTSSCGQYGGCQYREPCSERQEFRANVLTSLYPNVDLTQGDENGDSN